MSRRQQLLEAWEKFARGEHGISLDQALAGRALLFGDSQVHLEQASPEAQQGLKGLWQMTVGHLARVALELEAERQNSEEEL